MDQQLSKKLTYEALGTFFIGLTAKLAGEAAAVPIGAPLQLLLLPASRAHLPCSPLP